MLTVAPYLPWILAAIASLALLAAAAVLLLRGASRPPAPKPLPDVWNIAPRPVFSSAERRLYRQLREALPHHVILAKLPLVRFCQSNDPQEQRYWYELLGTIHISFAVCSTNGRVLAVIDLDNGRTTSRRRQQIKQAVIGALRIRFLRCPEDHFPSVPELQLLVPHSGSQRGPQAAPQPALHVPADSLTNLVASRRAQRSALWQDSSLFQDSFFSSDTREDPFSTSSSFGPKSGLPRDTQPGGAPDATGAPGPRLSRPAVAGAR